MIVESIHIRFDEIKEVSKTSFANNTSGLVPQRQKASDYDNPDPVPQREDVSSSEDADVPSQQELDLLFGPLYDEFFNAGSNLSTNIQSTSAPSTHINVHAEENNNDQAEEVKQLQDDEFTNPFCAPAQEQADSSSHNIGNSNVPTFNQPRVSEYRWTKDHPLEQVRGNPSRPVQTRRQLSTDPEMYMKALYGLKQAPRAWYDELSKFLTSKGFTKGTVDPNLFTIRYGEDILLVQIYVDDIIFGSTNPKYSKSFEKLMHSRFEMSLMVEMKFFLGLQIHQYPSGIFINQAKYNLEILHKHGMDKGQSIGTPMATKPKLDADLSGNPVDQTDYRSKIGSLMYLASSRPDKVQAVCLCARYQLRPTEKHLKEVKRIFKYLRGDKLVSWMSKKQNCTAMSSVEAEYVALSMSCAQVMSMRTQLQDYGFNYNKIPLYCDSQSTIAISCNPVQHSRTNHIHTRYHFIKEQVENGIIELYFVKTEYQLADMFTKSLPEDRFKYLVRRIGMRCLTPAELEVLVAFCPGLRFVLDCVLSSTAFCLFEDHLLRFAKDKLCQTQNCVAFCLRFRFNSEDRVLKNLAFCHRSTKSIPKANMSEGLSKPVNAQTLPQTTKKAIVQLILFIVDSGCTKHMTSNLKLLCNFVEKFLGTVRFGNDQFSPIIGYGDLAQGNVTINRVYYVEGLNHNLFSVGQFCDPDLEVAFRKSTCFVRDLQGNDLLIGNRGSDLYIILFKNQLHLLHSKDIVIFLPKLKYVKDQLCSSCELSKAKRSSFKSKAVPSSKGRLNLLHMDLCGPMRLASINGKKYILVIVDDYSRYTWTLFLRSKDEIPEVLKDFLTMIQRNLQASVITVRTERGTEFLNKTLNAFCKEEGIEHQTSTARTPEQNGIVKIRNRTPVEAARTM
nr:copia protein [Tanacetum cinerariifolium]